MRQSESTFRLSQAYPASASGITSKTVCRPPTRTVLLPSGGLSGRPCRSHSNAVRKGIASPSVISDARSSGDQTMLHPRRFQLCAVISCIVTPPPHAPESSSRVLIPVIEEAELPLQLGGLLTNPLQGLSQNRT